MIKTKNLVALQDSSDTCIHGANIDVDEGRRTLNCQKQDCKARIQEIIGVTNQVKKSLEKEKQSYLAKLILKVREILLSSQ